MLHDWKDKISPLIGGSIEVAEGVFVERKYFEDYMRTRSSLIRMDNRGSLPIPEWKKEGF